MTNVSTKLLICASLSAVALFATMPAANATPALGMCHLHAYGPDYDNNPDSDGLVHVPNTTQRDCQGNAIANQVNRRFIRIGSENRVSPAGIWEANDDSTPSTTPQLYQ